jgi:hypothetical protein
MRSGARIEKLQSASQKKRLPEYRQPLEKPTPRGRGVKTTYIALLVVVFVVVVVVEFMSVAFMSVAFMSVAFMSVAFMSVAFMSVVVRFSSTFMVLLALSLLLQAATARAAPATRIRARIQDSLFIAICRGFPRRKSREP